MRTKNVNLHQWTSEWEIVGAQSRGDNQNRPVDPTRSAAINNHTVSNSPDSLKYKWGESNYPSIPSFWTLQSRIMVLWLREKIFSTWCFIFSSFIVTSCHCIILKVKYSKFHWVATKGLIPNKYFLSQGKYVISARMQLLPACDYCLCVHVVIDNIWLLAVCGYCQHVVIANMC